MGTAFRKMHGLGNDFVVLDGRRTPLMMTGDTARAIADRRTGVGCDQLILLEPPRDALADAVMRIFNPDGSEVAACGNATRCVADLLMAELGRRHAVIQTAAGLLDAEAAPDGLVAVDMGPALLDWREIPLAEACDTLAVPVAVGPLAGPACVSMGNPHAVFFVSDVAAIPLADVGPLIEHHPMFPARTNVEVAELAGPDRLRVRVWERGAGITRACGSGACAVGVAAVRRGIAGRRVQVVLDGGELAIEWLRDGHVLMTGPVATSFVGELPVELGVELAA